MERRSPLVVCGINRWKYSRNPVIRMGITKLMSRVMIRNAEEIDEQKLLSSLSKWKLLQFIRCCYIYLLQSPSFSRADVGEISPQSGSSSGPPIANQSHRNYCNSSGKKKMRNCSFHVFFLECGETRENLCWRYELLRKLTGIETTGGKENSLGQK